MEKVTVIVRDDETKARAVTIINGLKLDPATEVVIKPHKLFLSDQQRKQYFVWCGYIGNDLGNTKDEQHLILKKEFLIPIFTREHEDYGKMIESLRAVYRNDKEEGLFLLNQVVKMTSIMDAKVSEMREYMSVVDNWAAGMSIRLPVEEDLDRRAWHR